MFLKQQEASSISFICKEEGAGRDSTVVNSGELNTYIILALPYDVLGYLG
jgi:hypothetical protein